MESISLFYDTYEDENGDGFYPYPINNGLTEIIITFKKTGHWYQVSSHSIMGFDGHGSEVLDKLEPNAKIGTKIFNNCGKLLFEKI